MNLNIINYQLSLNLYIYIYSILTQRRSAAYSYIWAAEQCIKSYHCGVHIVVQIINDLAEMYLQHVKLFVKSAFKQNQPIICINNHWLKYTMQNIIYTMQVANNWPTNMWSCLNIIEEMVLQVHYYHPFFKCFCWHGITGSH